MHLQEFGRRPALLGLIVVVFSKEDGTSCKILQINAWYLGKELDLNGKEVMNER